MRATGPFSTYMRSYARSWSGTRSTSVLAELAKDELLFLFLFVKLSECTDGVVYG